MNTQKTEDYVSFETAKLLKEKGEVKVPLRIYSINTDRYVYFDHYELDFLISHHFDYRGLIPKGLALEAPKDMYK